MLDLSGPCFQGIDNRLMSLQLVEQDLTDAVLFTAEGTVVEPADLLHGKPVLVERGSFRPVTNTTLDMLERAQALFCEELTDGREEVVALATTARKARPGAAASPPALELFTRKEVGPPQAAELPEFSLAAGSLQAVADRAAANVPGELQSRALLPTDFFELHFLELGEIALGPLLLRKSAAGGADSLQRAVVSMDAAGLQADTRAAVANATDRTLAVYAEQLERLLAMKAGNGRGDRDSRIDEEERERLMERMQAPFERLWMRFEGLEEQQEKLLGRLEDFDQGSPGEEDPELVEAADEWRATLGRLDSGYEAAWRELVEEIEKTWSTSLLPRLAHVTEYPSDGPPEWVKLAGIGMATLIVAALIIAWLVV